MGYGKAASVWVVLPPAKWALLIQGAANPGAGSRSAAADEMNNGSTGLATGEHQNDWDMGVTL